MSKTLSNRKSKTKICKINPSQRLISQKITVSQKAYFMEPLHDHGAPQAIWDFISIELFFHTVSACASNLLQRIEITVYVPVSFLWHIFGYNKALCNSIGRRQTCKQTQNAP